MRKIHVFFTRVQASWIKVAYVTCTAFLHMYISHVYSTLPAVYYIPAPRASSLEPWVSVCSSTTLSLDDEALVVTSCSSIKYSHSILKPRSTLVNTAWLTSNYRPTVSYWSYPDPVLVFLEKSGNETRWRLTESGALPVTCHVDYTGCPHVVYGPRTRMEWSRPANHACCRGSHNASFGLRVSYF